MLFTTGILEINSAVGMALPTSTSEEMGRSETTAEGQDGT